MVKLIDLFVPRDDRFFNMLKEHSSGVSKGVEKFSEFMGSYSTVTDRKQRVAEIKELEKSCDETTHGIIDTLNKTFITPIDREDIHTLAVLLDDVIDIIHSVSKKFHLYNIESVNEDVLAFTEIAMETVREVDNSVLNLRDFSKAKQHCIKIHELENVGDRLHEKAISRVFANGASPIEVIKMKDIYDDLEAVIDKCEHIANVIENIMVKHA